MRQTAYRLIVADDEAILAQNRGNVWDSKRVTSGLSTHIRYEGEPLMSGQRYYWKVLIWDELDKRTSWSQPASWEMGLLAENAWHAQWISTELKSEQPTWLRTTFNVNRPIKTARLYASALGCYEMYLNNCRVGDSYFTPGWTSYHHFLQYQTYDVTHLLSIGENVLGGIVADGWYRGNVMGHGRNFYGDQLGLIAQLAVTYEDGTQSIFGTDEKWYTTIGPITQADHYNGETYDARLERGFWGQDERIGWEPAVHLQAAEFNLVAQIGEPVRKKREIKPVALLTTPQGETVIDFGQNMVGWVRMAVDEPAGTAVTLTHAEVLDKDGNFYTQNLRAAQQKVTYISKGTAAVYEPRFSFQGFRYVKVEGMSSEKLKLDQFIGIVLYSDLEATGYFECSNSDINQLQKNIVWGQRGNFLDVPTDCPQRDERLGWTGDAQVFAPTACFNMNTAVFFHRWMKSLRADQRADGALPHVSPHVLGDDAFGATGWADAGIIVPWVVYQQYGDRRILAENYRAMQLWVQYMGQQAGENLLWQGDFHFGDWLSNERHDLGTPFGLTETDLIATAYFAYSTHLMGKIAAVFGRDADAEAYQNFSDQIKVAFCNEYLTPNGRLSSNTQTAYCLALAFDLLPEEFVELAVQRLAADIRYRGGHLSTGFLGTPLLCHVLSEHGQTELAYELLLQEAFPGWLYPIKQGATTIWERWDGLKPDGSFQDAGMNSFNHYAYGAIGDWLYRVVAGLSPDESLPGFKQAIIKPRPGGNLRYAKAELETVNGRFRIHWYFKEEDFFIEVVVPANASAKIYFPTSTISGVRESGRPLTQLRGVRETHSRNKQLTAIMGSGSYKFKIIGRFYQPLP
ncbi:MAG: family 78 glycoside hydrolase catalytic domain [Chloroflexota bacterium]